MKRIFYLVHYNVDNKIFKKRVSSPAAQTKVEYIISAINDCGYGVDIISPTVTMDKKGDKGGLFCFGDNTIKYFRVFGRKNVLQKVLTHLSLKIGLIFYIIKNVRKDDTLIAYHSLYFVRILKLLKKIKKFNLVLEVEEIYADVINNDKVKEKEISLFRYADSYIFPTELLNKKINVKNKPYCIIHGTYKVEQKREKLWEDDKIHIVYAGTLDPRKGGAITAVSIAEFLDSKYHIHILGFGGENDKECLLREINRVSTISECIVTYDSCLSGEEYIKFIQSCDIGLSTQNPDASFNDTSFPSKILSYLANGLRVVTVKIPVIEQSFVNNQMYYYSEQSAECIADIIEEIDFNDEYNSREKINELDFKFKEELSKLLNRSEESEKT